MKIGICGLPGTPVIEICEKLSERLELSYIHFEPTSTFKNMSLDTYRNSDLVTDDYTFTKLLKGFTFGVYSSLSTEILSPVSLKEARDNFKDDFNPDIFDCYLDCSLMSVDDIVDQIVYVLQTGRYGIYVNPKLVLPLCQPCNWDSKLFYDLSPDADYVATLECKDNSYFIRSNVERAFTCLKNNKMMRVSLNPVTGEPVIRESDIREWERLLSIDYTFAVTQFELSMYTYKFGYKTWEDAYVDLCHNSSDPVRKMHSLNCRISI